MKIKAVAQLCKKAKTIILYKYTRNDVQWIGCGGAAYPISGLPQLELDNVCMIFDLTEKDQEKLLLREKVIPDGICIDDVDENETIAERGPFSIFVGGKMLIPYQTQEGILFIDAQYLSPLSKIEDIEFYERETSGGQTYFAVKSGFMIYAVIFHFDIIKQDFIKNLDSLTNQCKIAFENKSSSAGSSEEISQVSVIKELD